MVCLKSSTAGGACIHYENDMHEMFETWSITAVHCRECDRSLPIPYPLPELLRELTSINVFSLFRVMYQLQGQTLIWTVLECGV